MIDAGILDNDFVLVKQQPCEAPRDSFIIATISRFSEKNKFICNIL